MARNKADAGTAFDPALLIGGMVEALHGLLMVVGRDYRVLLSNLQDRNSVGASPTEGLPFCYQLLRHRSSPCPLCYAKEVFRTGRPLQTDHHDELTGRIEDIQVSPVKDSRGRTIVVAEHIVDVTSRREEQKKLKRTAASNAALSWLGGELLRVSGQRELGEAVMRCALQTTGSPKGFVGLVTDARAETTLIAALQWNDPRFSRRQPQPAELMDALWERLRQRGEPILSNDPSRDARLRVLPADAAGLERLLCMPAVVDDRLVGLVAVADAGRSYDRQDLGVFKRIAALFAMAVRHLLDDEAVLAQQRRLRDLAVQLGAAEERRERSIAEDLHDSVGQYLSMASQRLKMLRVDRPPPGETLDQIIDLIDRAINQTRSLTVQLSPPVLHHLGLEAALEWLAENSRESMGLEVNVSYDGSERPLDDSTRAFVFRAITELLRNVAKHSGVERAEVGLTRDGDRLAVMVKDRGRGFDSKARPLSEGSCFGLFSIEQRIISLGGSFRVASRPGGGTEAQMLVPLAVTRKGSA